MKVYLKEFFKTEKIDFSIQYLLKIIKKGIRAFNLIVFVEPGYVVEYQIYFQNKSLKDILEIISNYIEYNHKSKFRYNSYIKDSNLLIEGYISSISGIPNLLNTKQEYIYCVYDGANNNIYSEKDLDNVSVKTPAISSNFQEEKFIEEYYINNKGDKIKMKAPLFFDSKELVCFIEIIKL